MSANSAASSAGGGGLRQYRIELVELHLRGVVVHKPGGAFHLADDRIKGAVSVLGGAEIAQAACAARRRGCSSSAAVSRDLPMPASPERSTTWPSPVFAFDQRRSSSSSSSSRPTSSVRSARVQRLEAALNRSRPQRRPGSHRRCDALEVLGPEVLQARTDCRAVFVCSRR